MTRSHLLAGAGRLALVLAALGLSTVGAHAEDAAAADSATQVSSVTVVGKPVETAPAVPPLSTPYTVDTITSDQVRALPDSPTVNIQSMLNNMPSFYATTDGPNEGINVEFRAFNSGQFSETYEGVPLNDVFNGGVTNQASVVNGTLLLPRNVDSVQVYRGINNPAVNSYNSLGGTINFLPRMPTNDFNAQIGGSYGSFDSYDVHAQINTGDVNGLKQFLAYDHAESGGWLAYTGDRNTNIYYSAAYDAPNGDHASLVVVYDHNNGKSPFQEPLAVLQPGGFNNLPPSDEYENDRDTQWMAILDFRMPISSAISFDQKIFGATDNYLRTSFANPNYNGQYPLQNNPTGFAFWLSTAYPYPSGPTYDPASVFGSVQAGTAYHFYGYTTWTVGYQPTVTIDLPHNEIVAGGNFTYGNLHSREYWYGAYNMPMTPGYNDAWDEHDWRILANGFVQDTISLFDNRLTLTPGVKFIFANTFDNDQVGFYYPYAGSPSDTEHYIAPTVGVNYQITHDVAAFFAFGQNIKFPDIGAFYGAVPAYANAAGGAAFQTPPITIKPEHVNDFEGGLRYEHGGLYLEADIYRENFTNTFITQFNAVTGSTAVSNGGNSRYQGIELQARDAFDLGAYGKLAPFINYSYNQAQYTSAFSDQASGLTVAAGEPLANVPMDEMQFGVTWTYDGWSVNAVGRRIGGEFIVNNDTGGTTGVKNPAYFTADLGIEKTFPLHGIGILAKSVTASLNFTNLFNKYFLNTYYFQGGAEYATPGAPRAILGRVDLNF
ncbi:MAG: TonB-dependent receptor [Alphaproteobacteria bacterium]|nr:TonB-dependent receptor [Alphaproteobacteria bacterium]